MIDAARHGMLIFTGVILFPVDALACSVCVGWTEGQGLHAGFYVSALLLTLLPFAVVAVVGAWVSYATWRARRSAHYERRGDTL